MWKALCPGSIPRCGTERWRWTSGSKASFLGAPVLTSRWDGTIELDRIQDTLHVGRPAYGQPGSKVGLFRIAPDGQTAVRVQVELGRTSVNRIEVLNGLAEGDEIILSDTSAWDTWDQIRLR